MGQVVGAFATSHILFGRKSGAGEQAETCFSGFKRIGQRIQELDPSVVIVASSEHGPTLPPGGPQPPFCLGTGQTFRTFGEAGIPRLELQGAPALAEQIVGGVARAGFDVAMCDDFVADHGVALPSLLTMPKRPFPIVPLVININVPLVVPTARRVYDLGVAVREAVREVCGPEERVVVLGTGGLSHWLGTPEMGRINEEFDRECLDLLASGKGHELAQLSNEEIVERAGNGGQELRSWLFAAAVAGDHGGTCLYYEPVAQWFTGMAAMEFSTNGA